MSRRHPNNRGMKVTWLYRRQRERAEGPALCLLCGLPFASRREVTIDHLLPVSMGGDHRLENLALAHSRCNGARGSQLLSPEQQARHDRWFPGPKSFTIVGGRAVNDWPEFQR